MKIMLVNKFLYPKGGDAISTLTTGEILSKNGHEVFFWGMDHPSNPHYTYKRHFVSYIDYGASFSLLEKAKSAFNILYS